jgi:ankyrin repeat protein
MKEWFVMVLVLWGGLLPGSYAGEIHNAIQAGDERMVVSLLRSNAHVLVEPDDYTKETPLHVAAHTGRTNILIYLLESHAPIEATNSTGQTPLHYALFANGSMEPQAALTTVRILIIRGANVNALDLTRETPLHYAAENGQLKIAETLLQNGAKSGLGNGHALGTPLVQAAKAGQREMVEFFLSRGASTEETGKDHATALSIAAYFGKTNVMATLLDHSARIDAVDENASSALHYAVAGGRGVNAIKLLLERKANFNLEDEYGLTPLGKCLRDLDKRFSAPMAEIFRAYGSTNSGSGKWTGAIHQAVVLGMIDKVKEVLVARPSLVNAKDDSGETPLHVAAETHHKAIAELLLASGAEVEIRDKRGLTPLHKAAVTDSLAIVELLCSGKANLAARDEDGWTPLHYAAYRASASVVDALVRRGADVTAKTKDGRTPLDLALAAGNRQVISILMAPKKSPPSI